MPLTRVAGGSLTALAVLAAGLAVAPAPRADQNDPRLDPLFETLRTTADPQVADHTEAAIWRIWQESGNAAVDDLLQRGIAAMQAGSFDTAIDLFTRVIEQAPKFAEGWNKRATAYYLADDLDASVADIERTLALEPRHFGALSGLGLIFMRRGDEIGAMRAFEAVLRINPHAPGARSHLERIRRDLQDKRVRGGRAAPRGRWT